MLEDHLYWTVVHARFIDEANFAKGPSTFFRAISAPVRPLVVAMVRRQVTRYMRNAPLQFAPKDWFGFFEAHCWRPGEVRYIAEEAERLGRPFPMRLPMKLVWPFVSRDRRRRMKRFAAYGLLLPT
jgi:hypothetical protein